MFQNLICLISILLLSVSCAEKGSSSNKNSAESRDEEQDKGRIETTPSKTNICRDQKILKILDNGNNIISKLQGDQNQLINWSLSSESVVDSFMTPLLPSFISRDGSLLIRKVSYRKYQVMSYKRGLSDTLFTLTINAVVDPAPEVSFSPDAQYIILKYRPYISGHSKKITVYSVKYREVAFTANYDDIYYSKIDRFERNIFMIVSNGSKKYLVKHDLFSGRVMFKVPLLNNEVETQLELSIDKILISFQSKIVGYSLFTGNEEFTIPAFYLYDIDDTGTLALVNKNRDEFEVLNTTTGEIENKFKKEKGIVFSSCQLTTAPLKLTCLDADNSNNIIKWNLELNKIESVCF